MINKHTDPSPTVKTKLFISYSRKDAAFADDLAQALALRGYEIFIDRRDIPPLEEWKREISHLIDRSDTIVLIISKNSMTSNVVQWEIAQAVASGKRLAPVVIDDVQSNLIPEALSLFNYVSFLPPLSFEQQSELLCLALETDVEWIREHTRIGNSAQRWSIKGRPKSLCLRGPDLTEAISWLATPPRSAPPPTQLQVEYIEKSKQLSREHRLAWLTLIPALPVAWIILNILRLTPYWDSVLFHIFLPDKNIWIDVNDAMVLVGLFALWADLARMHLSLIHLRIYWIASTVFLIFSLIGVFVTNNQGPLFFVVYFFVVMEVGFASSILRSRADKGARDLSARQQADATQKLITTYGAMPLLLMPFVVYNVAAVAAALSGASLGKSIFDQDAFMVPMLTYSRRFTWGELLLLCSVPLFAIELTRRWRRHIVASVAHHVTSVLLVIAALTVLVLFGYVFSSTYTTKTFLFLTVMLIVSTANATVMPFRNASNESLDSWMEDPGYNWRSYTGIALVAVSGLLIIMFALPPFGF
jgi:hypothetical protein